jgi:sn-glycerol 3-phosphate transport system substrate-binding protein
MARSGWWTQCRVGSIVVASVVSAAACGSGESVLLAGNDSVATSTAAPPTSPTSDSTGVAPGPAPSVAPGPAPADSMEFACPVEALADVTEPVEIVFWHGLTVENAVALERIVAEYNVSQDRVRVVIDNQVGYGETIDKFFQSGVAARPQVVMFPEYLVQQAADSGSVVPIGSCVETAGYDTGSFQPSALAAYTTSGAQWGMPFNVASPVLFYNRAAFERAGLDPDRPPTSLVELREFSEVIVASGAASYGIALDSGVDNGGGWVLEQWFAAAGEFFADNGNGRLGPASRVLYDGPFGVELLTYLRQLVDDGLAFDVGSNPSGIDTFLKLVDPAEPAAMTIGTSAALGTVLAAVGGGMATGFTVDDLGVGPLPGPGPRPTALIGGAALYAVGGHDDVEIAAAWDFIGHMVGAEIQSSWATLTGFVPVRLDALDLEPSVSVYAQDPRFRVAFDQLVGSVDDPVLQGPILGPRREIRVLTARAVAEILAGADPEVALSDAAAKANVLLADYTARR